MRRLVLALVLLAAPAYAQAPFPGAVLVNGGWVPCTHPIAINAGLGCTATTPRVPAILGGPLATFIPGRVYEMPYGHRMRVLTLTVTTAGETAVMGEWVIGAGGIRPPNMGGSDVFAFVVGDAVSRKWWAIDAP